MPSATTELIARLALKWLEKRPFSKEARERRRAKRKARKEAQLTGQALPAEESEVSMNLGNEIGKSLVRHFGSGTAGAIVGTGVATADEASIFVQVAVGLLIFAATQGWSIVRKVGRAKAKPAA